MPPKASHTKIDREMLHYLLWTKAHSRLRTVTVNQTEWAGVLHVSLQTMTRVLADLVDTGRLVKTARAGRGLSTFVVNDPADFK